MRNLKLLGLTLALVIIPLVINVNSQYTASAQQDLSFVSQAQFEDWKQNINNWGRWAQTMKLVHSI